MDAPIPLGRNDIRATTAFINAAHAALSSRMLASLANGCHPARRAPTRTRGRRGLAQRAAEVGADPRVSMRSGRG